MKIKIGHRSVEIEPAADLNLGPLVAKHTAFASMAEMVAAAGGYRPSIYLDGKPLKAKRELLAIVLVYNAKQAAAGDPRRVYCGDFQLPEAV